MIRTALAGTLRPRLEYQIKRGLRGAAESREAARRYHLAQPFFASLRSQRQSNFLRQRSRST